MVNRRGAAENMAAMHPATWGAAMLVPDIRVNSGVPARGSRGAERAARTNTPGAQRSGFWRPSRVGPELLNEASSRSRECALYAPTAIVRKPLQIVPVVLVGTTLSGS